MTKTTTLIAAALLWIPLAFSEKLPKPDRVGADATAAEAALINQGVALHDRQDYDGAIALYKQVLAGSPTQVTALYEMSYSLFSARRYEDSLAVARDGIRYRPKSFRIST